MIIFELQISQNYKTLCILEQLDRLYLGHCENMVILLLFCWSRLQNSETWTFFVLSLLFFIIPAGYVGSSGSPTKTTEIITYDPPSVKEGPLLPEYFRYHCSVIVDNLVYLIGGFDTRSKVLAIDVRTSNMTYKSELNHGRYRHACAKITGSNPKIIVSGGYYNGNYFKSTEIYNIANDSWENGK